MNNLEHEIATLFDSGDNLNKWLNDEQNIIGRPMSEKRIIYNLQQLNTILQPILANMSEAIVPLYDQYETWEALEKKLLSADEQRKKNFSECQSLYFEDTAGMTQRNKEAYTMGILGAFFKRFTGQEYARMSRPITSALMEEKQEVA